MCGLVGDVFFAADRQNNRDLTEDLNILKHRGPDGQGQWREGPCVLGHVRLSIIDLSVDGSQPFHSQCGRWHFVFNGEIYNYLELKEDLKKQGVHFKTKTDTEVLLYVLSRWGWRGLNRCNGMWALALWDSQKQELLLARDRFGIKPLFLRQDQDSLRFASEIKALINPREKPSIDRTFLYNFIDRKESFQLNKTLYQDIDQLPSGHCLSVKKGQVKIWPWYEFSVSQEIQSLNYEDRKQKIKETLIESVKFRLRGDVPVGVCLSGGIDSSIVTGILSEHLKIPVRTFSTVHRQPSYNEEKYIDEVNLFCQAQSKKVSPKTDKFAQVLEQLIRAHDRPVRMPGTFSHWHVMQLASTDVTVLLDGQGADELFGGYRYFYPAAQEGWLNRMTQGDVKALELFFDSFVGIQKNIPGSGLVKEFLARMKRRIVGSKKNRRRWQDQVVSESFMQESKHEDSFNGTIPFFQEPLDQELYQTFFVNNLPMLLDYEDRISMAFSLEARVPFLDHRLVELAFSLPVDDKIRGYTNKAILRESFQDVIPKGVFERKDKLGFPTPTEIWFRQDLKDLIAERISDSSVDRHGFFDRQKLNKIWREHLEGNRNHERLLWRVISIETWAHNYLDRFSRE